MCRHAADSKGGKQLPGARIGNIGRWLHCETMVAKNTPGEGLPDPSERLWVHPAELPALAGAPRVPMRPRRSPLATVRRGLRHPLFAGVVGAGMVLAGTVMLGFSNGQEAPITPAVSASSPTDQLGGFPAGDTEGRPDYSTLNQARASVIQILTSDGDQHLVATALVLNDRQLITADPGLSDHGEIVAAVRPDQLVAAHILRSDQASGLAILEVDGKVPASLPRVDGLQHKRPSPAQGCLMVSASPSLHGTDLIGTCTVQSEETSDADLASSGLFSVQGNFQGSDRGALILDEDNQPMGIVVQTLPDDSGHAVALRIDEAVRVAQSVPSTPELSGLAGLHVADLTAQLAVESGLGMGAVVVSVAADSPAAASGIRSDDVILAVNDGATASANQFRLKAGQLRPGEPASLKIWREGQQINLTVTP